VIVSDNKGVYKLVADARWEKTCHKILWFATYLGLEEAGDEEEALAKDRKGCPIGWLPHKTAESYRGFLEYVSCTYGAMVPYLKGIHLMLDSWRPNRDDDGWRNMSTVEPSCEGEEREKPPRFVNIVPRLRPDVEVLMRFTRTEKPPRVPVRPTGSTVCMYMFGDASGSGLGVSLWVAGQGTVYTAHGS
jgi:hypothetical protein